MPTLEYIPDPPKTGSNYDASVLDQTLVDQDDGPKPKRWKLRLKRRPDAEDKDAKKKNKKKNKKKHDSPQPEEEEEWELGPTMEEMRAGTVVFLFILLFVLLFGVFVLGIGSTFQAQFPSFRLRTVVLLH